MARKHSIEAVVPRMAGRVEAEDLADNDADIAGRWGGGEEGGQVSKRAETRQ